MTGKAISPDDIEKKFGPSHCRGFHTIVDERISRVRIIEKCIARGPVEWDAVNRMRAGGALLDYTLDGTTLIMDAVLDNEGTGTGECIKSPGEVESPGREENGRPLRFGPASADTGGQALVSATLSGDGNEMRTRWMGIAGASVGIGACLVTSPDVIRAEYRDFTGIGGSHTVDVTLTTPALRRLVIGVDDTDNREKGATWSLVMRLARALEKEAGAVFLDLKIIQLCPLVPEKTTNCVSVALSVAVPRDRLGNARSAALAFIRRHTLSGDTGMAFLEGLRIPERVVRYAEEAKRSLKTVDEAADVAERNGVDLVPVTGQRGMIGALAAIGFCEKDEAAMLHSDYSGESTSGKC